MDTYVRSTINLSYFFPKMVPFLFSCAEKGDIDGVRLALKRGDDVHHNNDSALRASVYYGHLEVVQLLLDHGANVHAQNGFSLAFASKHGYLNIVKLLLERGASIFSIYHNSLSYAVNAGHVEVSRTLLEYGANINTIGEVELEYIAVYGTSKMLRFLLDYGLNVRTMDCNCAIRRSLVNTDGYLFVKLLIDAGASIQELSESTFCRIVEYNKIDILDLLLQHSAKVTDYDFGFYWWKSTTQNDYDNNRRNLAAYAPQFYDNDNPKCCPNMKDFARFIQAFGFLHRHVHTLSELSKRYIVLFMNYSLESIYDDVDIYTILKKVSLLINY
jgi:ankyrin repeat protein